MREELRYTLSTIDRVADVFGAAASPDVAARYPIAPGEHAPVVFEGAIAMRRWGLLRRFRGHGGKRGPAIYTAPMTSVPLPPQLRDARPCLVLADGILAHRGASPLWVHPEPPRVVAFAGLCETSADDEVPSFALLVGDSLLHTLQQLMPIVVAPDAHSRWLEDRDLVRAEHDDWRADSPTKIENQSQRELF
jgi:putative SOS response-associated peptidase YedK